jgi:DNA-binding FadR family transcriptional regulator
MSFKFQRARQQRVFQDVAEQIEEAIVENRLKIGDMLPAERELREMFEVSRGTLREALRVLEQKGLIESKLGAGGGALVKPVTTELVTESLGLLIRHQKVSLDHLAEFREGVEGNVAGLAAERATKADIKRLKKLLAEAQHYLERDVSDWEAFVRIDEQMHIALPRITGNPVYTSVLQMVHDNIHRYYESFLPREEHVLWRNYQDLCDIVRAVEKGLANEARSLAQHHVRRFHRFMKKEQQKHATTR